MGTGDGQAAQTVGTGDRDKELVAQIGGETADTRYVKDLGGRDLTYYPDAIRDAVGEAPGEASVGLISFAKNSSTIHEKHRVGLRRLVDALQAKVQDALWLEIEVNGQRRAVAPRPDALIRSITGFASQEGKDASNEVLSENRAKKTWEELKALLNWQEPPEPVDSGSIIIY